MEPLDEHEPEISCRSHDGIDLLQALSSKAFAGTCVLFPKAVYEFPKPFR